MGLNIDKTRLKASIVPAAVAFFATFLLTQEMRVAVIVAVAVILANMLVK